jgi:cytochrome c biogenesis protein CcmG/thiol:disulfide interchange protein DsbE
MPLKNIFLGFCFWFLFMETMTAQDTSSFIYIQETSRPENLIKKEFPYDIELKDAQGNVVNSSTLLNNKKKATVLLFWMTTCGPCRRELNAISGKFNQWKTQTDFDFYAISIDFPNRVEQFNKRVVESKWTFPAYHDFNREFRYVMEEGLNGLPQVFVLGNKGKVVYHTKRYLPGDEEKLFSIIKNL